MAETFAPREIPDDATREFTTRSITSAPYRHRYRVRMHAPATGVTRHFGPTIADITPIDEKTCELTAGSNSPEEFALYVGLAGIDFDVVEGDDLRRALDVLGARFTRA